jgi:predicted secreted protein
MALRKIIGKTGKATWQIDYLEPNGNRVRKNFKKEKDAEAESDKRISLKAENRCLQHG